MDGNMKIVEFWNYCKDCKYKNKDGNEEPCAECMETPAREDSHKPINFKEKKKKKNG